MSRARVVLALDDDVSTDQIYPGRVQRLPRTVFAIPLPSIRKTLHLRSRL